MTRSPIKTGKMKIFCDPKKLAVMMPIKKGINSRTTG